MRHPRIPIGENMANFPLSTANLLGLGAPLSLLRHPFVLKTFVDVVINPGRQLALVELAKLSRLLAVACVIDDCSCGAVDPAAVDEALRVESNILCVFSLCKDIMKSVMLNLCNCNFTSIG